MLLVSCGCSASTRPISTSPPTSEEIALTDEGDDDDSPWTRCYASFATTGNPRSDLERLTESCGSLGGMQPITDIQAGEQTDKDPVDRYTFYVGAPGKCYRVYATGTTNVEDLDLILRDPEGDEIVADLSHDAWPVLPPREPVCFDKPGLYILEVSVYRGAGRYALQVWGR